ncbi:hypothetical protein IAU60_000396 [Kwoniella sp. DSM 27419]
MSQSQPYADYTFEPTQLSQPYFSQTQGTQGTAFANSQVEPRRKYWAVLIPTDAGRDILKIPWSKPSIQMGRGPYVLSKNDVVLSEKRISNIHCKITLGMQGPNGSGGSGATVQSWKDGEAEPEVWIEDLKSSNGTFVNGNRVSPRRLLRHGDEVSLGHAGTLENHDVRYIFRSVGSRGVKLEQEGSKAHDVVGAVYERYQILGRLGKGTFAEVRKAVDVESGALRAVKQIIKHRFAGNQKTMNLFHREIEISRSLQHENICRLIDYFEDPQHICLVLEYVDGGDLLDYIMNWPSELGGGLPEDDAADLSVQIVRGMAYTNILLTATTPPIVKIADFGLAKMVHAETMLTSMVGTPQYLAPEVVMQTKQQPGYENVVDSWSVGIIVYSFAFRRGRRVACRTTDQSEVYSESRRRAATEVGHQPDSRLLAKEPSQRMSMAAALDHEWLAGPSSQRSESQAQVLGGDSAWSIESFDEDDDDFYPGGGTGFYNRPMSASGTNFESVAGHSSEDFSQPMGNLHLNTPSIRPTTRQIETTPANSIPPSPPSTTVSAPPPVLATPAQPPQPDLVPESMPVDAVDGVDGTKRAVTPAELKVEVVQDHQAIPPSPLSPVEVLTSKRKGDEQMFSSGSLSPPPADVANGMDGIGHDGPQDRQPGMPRRTASPRSPTAGKLGRLPTRQSTRSTRARKSMRLA